jgi:GNAT superfamily N-acetyltransferase
VAPWPPSLVEHLAWRRVDRGVRDVSEYEITCDKSKLDVGLVHRYLSEDSYWAQGRTLEVVHRSIEASLCFGVYKGTRQVGFARVVTDGATFAWLCDVFIIDEHRGLGLGKRLVERVVAEPVLQGLGIFLLATRDAHELYARYGRFTSLDTPGKWMIRRRTGPRDRTG